MPAPPRELIRFLNRFDPAIRELDVYVLAMNYGFSERMKDQVVYVGVYAKHINLGFYWGAQMDDPEGVLEGSGKKLRHIKIRSQADLGTPVIRDYLRRAAPDGSVRSKTLKTKISILVGARPNRLGSRKKAVDRSS